MQKRRLPMQHSKSKVVGNLMSRCSNSSPRYMRENHYAILAHLKISYVFNNKISITLLLFLVCLGKSCLNPSTKLLFFLGYLLCLSLFLHFAHVNYPIITQFNKGILDIDENNPPKCSFTVFCTAIGSRSTKNTEIQQYRAIP